MALQCMHIIYYLLVSEQTLNFLPDQLPPLVQAVQKSWLASCGSSTILVSVIPKLCSGAYLIHQSAMLTLISVHLWSFFKNDTSFSEAGESGPPFVALIILSYCSIILNMSSTVTSMILTDKLGDLPIYASRRKTYAPEGGWFAGGSLELLECFGTGRSWTWTMWHCE